VKKKSTPNSGFERKTFANVRDLSIVGNSVTLTPQPESPAFGTIAPPQPINVTEAVNEAFRTNSPSLLKEAEQFTQIQIQKELEGIKNILPEFPEPSRFYILGLNRQKQLVWLETQTCE
jgi:hypothetical protein